MTIDFIERMRDFVNAGSPLFPCKLGALEGENSLVLYPLPNSKVIQEYFDGIKDKEYNFQFDIKSKGQNLNAQNALAEISERLSNVEDIPSINGSYDFLNVDVVSESFFAGKDTQGFFYYSLNIKAFLTIKRED